MNPRDARPLTDDDPTVEEEAPDFDPTRTDQIEKPTFVSAREDSAGSGEHDERASEAPPPSEPDPSPQSGYNPYDTNAAPPPRKGR
jgi:hypothetical protein